jgi:hypothetical protein
MMGYLFKYRDNFSNVLRTGSDDVYWDLRPHDKRPSESKD